MKIQFFNFDKIKIQITIRTSAMIDLITDAITQSSSPNPEIEIGPKIVTRIPPPTIIKTHIENKNPKRSDFKLRLPS